MIHCVFLILDVPNEVKSERCESKEQNPEIPCHSHGTGEQLSDQFDQKESTTHTNARSAADGKVPAPKPRNRTGNKVRAKKWVPTSLSFNKLLIIHHRFSNFCDDICVLRMEKKAPQNRKVTDYYPIRRSNRKTKEELKVCMKGSNILILVFLNGCLFIS